MIEKIDIKEVERSLPSGTPNKVRALDANGNPISSSLREVAQALPKRNIYSVEVKSGDTHLLSGSTYQTLLIYETSLAGAGCIALMQWRDIFLMGDSFFKNTNTPGFICIYNDGVGNPIIKNNTERSYTFSINTV